MDLGIENAAILSSNIDKSQIPPIHQKRILAFVNHFLISTCTFLNNFAGTCETKFIDIERKIQKVEASLIIVEAKLSSIPANDEQQQTTNVLLVAVETSTDVPVTGDPELSSQPEEIRIPEQEQPVAEAITGVRAADDVRYKKFFKMVQFGVPAAAVKLKMSAEGLDSTLLDKPDCILPDGVGETHNNTNE